MPKPVIAQELRSVSAVLSAIDCERCELLNPMAYLDVSYSDHAILSDDQMISVEREIHASKNSTAMPSPVG